MMDVPAGKLPSLRSAIWLSVALAVATSTISPSLSVLDSASAAGAAAAKQAVAGAIRTGNFLGVTFGFPSGTLAGTSYKNGDNTIYDYPMYVPDGNETHFWDSYVEQLETAGVDFVAPTIRGINPDNPEFNGGGDTPKLANLVAAIQRRGANLKISALDDTAYSLTHMKNRTKHNLGGYNPKFDLADVDGSGEGGYKYIWDRNLRLWFEAVPPSVRFTLDGRPVIYEWSLDNTFFVNQGSGNAAAMLGYVKQKAEAEFGITPYFIVDDSWIAVDPAVTNVADGVDSWFSLANSYTLATFKGRTYGTLVPAFNTGAGSTLRSIDPDHGNTLRTGLANTVGKGAVVTLVEGFSDWKENCALWRGRPGAYAATHYDYPNQRINILRQYSRDPFPAGIRIEAEGADSYYDTTVGNTFNVYRDGDIDVEATTDGGPGWTVASTEAGEWLQWEEIPLNGTITLKARIASVSEGKQIRFDIDGEPGPISTMPNTGAWTTYETVNAGTFTLPANSVHTVRVNFLNGGVRLNYWSN